MVARREPWMLALAMRVVGLAGLLVPRPLRADWTREWRAELWHLHRSDGGRPGGAAAFLLRTLGSVPDALQLRAGDAQEWSESTSAVIARWGEHAPAVTVGLLLLSIGIAADTLLLAFGRATLGEPTSPWSALIGEERTIILGVTVACGMALIAASAVAAARLLAFAEAAVRGDPAARVVETLLVAGVTAWVARWFAVFGVRSVTPPRGAPWLAPVDLGSAIPRAWLVSWLAALALLLLVRALRRHPVAAGRELRRRRAP